MRHRVNTVKLNRTSSHRKAMFRNMVTSLFKHDKIRTTDAKAKELRRWADHLITLAKRGDLHARRQALSIIREKAVVHKLFAEADERFGSVSGGYTRIIKIGRRAGDAAAVSFIELVSKEDVPPEKKKKKKAASKKTTPADTSVDSDVKETASDKAEFSSEKDDKKEDEAVSEASGETDTVEEAATTSADDEAKAAEDVSVTEDAVDEDQEADGATEETPVDPDSDPDKKEE